MSATPFRLFAALESVKKLVIPEDWGGEPYPSGEQLNEDSIGILPNVEG
jgi:hypothetical protein